MQIFGGVASFAVRALHLHDHRNCLFRIFRQCYSVRALGVPAKRGSITGSVRFGEETPGSVDALQIIRNLRTERAAFEMSTEENVGILSYANSLSGFRGILKQRFSDFIVNEVDLEGNVVHLSDLEAPLEERVKVVKVSEEGVADDVEEANGEKQSKPLTDDNAADISAFKEIAGDSNAQVLEDLLVQIANCKGDPVPPVLLAPDDDKNHRAMIHTFFKSRLTFITSDTVDGPSTTDKCIRLRHQPRNQGGGNRFQKRGREHGGRGRGWGRDNKRQKATEGGLEQPYDARDSDGWPSERPKFLRFHLYKENKDTQDALTVIGRMLHVQPKNFGFAGTKDKRAITTQQVTVFKQSAAKMAALNQRLFGMRVGNFSYVDKSLVLGMLSGNRFTITLRGVVAETDKSIENAVKGLGESGFINYFGLQRFGSGSIATHNVGAALIRGEWKAAAELILNPREEDQPEVKEAREYFKKTGNVDGALHKFPRYLTAERAILGSLKRDSKNYLQAICSIPRTLRLMYVHSYQSFLWNHAASHRAKTYGVDKVVEGDLVYDKDFQGTAEAPESKISDPSVNDSEVRAPELLIDDVIEADVPAEASNKIKCLTKEDIASGKYSISDVLLPLPGGSSIFPANDTAGVYHDMASKDSVDLHKSTHNVKEFALPLLPGAYRLFLQKPVDLKWKILKYSDPTETLAETDLDRIQKKNPVESTEDSKNKDNEQTAFQLSFTLPASCYATMALRELMKISTSVAFHKTLNDEPVVSAKATST